MTSSWSFILQPRVLFIHTTRQFKVSLIWHYQVTECSFTVHKMHFPKQNHGLTVLAQCVRAEKVNRNEASIEPICSTWWRPLDVSCAFRLGLQCVAARKRPVFSGVRAVLILPPGFLCVAEAVFRNFGTQFVMVLRTGNYPCLLNIRFVAMTEALFLRNGSTAKARHTPDHWFVFTKWRP